MQRIPEPELMDGADQARAYAEADFEAPHSMFIELLRQRLASPAPRGTVLDLVHRHIEKRLAATLPAEQHRGVVYLSAHQQY